jgi:hypothetical protein
LKKLFYSGPGLAALHEGYTKRRRVDANAPLLSSSSIEIRSPGEAVWATIVAFRDWRTWAPAIDMPDVPELAPDVSFQWRLNGITIRSVVGVVDVGQELNWTGAFLWFRAVERYVLERVGPDHTRVTLTESLSGWLLPLFYSAAQLRANHQRWLDALKTHIEGASGVERQPLAG